MLIGRENEIITSYGLAPGGYSNDIQCQLTMADLFR